MISKGQCFPLDIYEFSDGVETAERTNERTNEIIHREVPSNIAICLTTTGGKGFSVLITDQIPDLHLIGDVQCFPMFLYETE